MLRFQLELKAELSILLSKNVCEQVNEQLRKASQG